MKNEKNLNLKTFVVDQQKKREKFDWKATWNMREIQWKLWKTDEDTTKKSAWIKFEFYEKKHIA